MGQEVDNHRQQEVVRSQALLRPQEKLGLNRMLALDIQAVVVVGAVAGRNLHSPGQEVGGVHHHHHLAAAHLMQNLLLLQSRTLAQHNAASFDLQQRVVGGRLVQEMCSLGPRVGWGHNALAGIGLYLAHHKECCSAAASSSRCLTWVEPSLLLLVELGRTSPG